MPQVPQAPQVLGQAGAGVRRRAGAGPVAAGARAGCAAYVRAAVRGVIARTRA